MLGCVLMFSLLASGGFEQVTCLDWSPDGTLFLFSHQGQLHLASAPDGREARPVEGTAGVDWGRFHPSGEWIVYATRTEDGYTLWQHPLDEEIERQELHSSSAPLAEPVISPDGKRMAFVSREGAYWDVYLLDIPNGEPDRLTSTEWHVRSPDFTPDGEGLVFVGLWGESWDLFYFDIEREALEQLTTDEHFYWTPRVSPDGEWIAFEARLEEHSDIYVIRRDGTDLTPFTNDRWRNAFPAWSRDGDELAYASRRVGGWVFTTQGTY